MNTFDDKSVRRISKAVIRSERQRRDRTDPPVRRLQAIPLEKTLWGEITEAWTPGSQTVTLQPVQDINGTPFDDPPSPITVRIVMPVGRAPSDFNADPEEVLPYRTLAEDMYVLLTPDLSKKAKWGKITSYTAGSNQVTLDPCNSAGTDNGRPNVTCYIELPTSKTHCSFFDPGHEDPILYETDGDISYLVNYPRPSSVTNYDVYTTDEDGQGGWGSVKIKG